MPSLSNVRTSKCSIALIHISSTVKSNIQVKKNKWENLCAVERISSVWETVRLCPLCHLLYCSTWSRTRERAFHPLPWQQLKPLLFFFSSLPHMLGDRSVKDVWNSRSSILDKELLKCHLLGVVFPQRRHYSIGETYPHHSIGCEEYFGYCRQSPFFFFFLLLSVLAHKNSLIRLGFLFLSMLLCISVEAEICLRY